MRPRLWLMLPLAVAALTAVPGPAAPQAPPPPPAPSPEALAGRDLYVTGCSTCHGLDGSGGSVGPNLLGIGAASVDFQVSSGRMPLDQPRTQADRKPAAYTSEQTEQLVAYVEHLTAAAGKPPGPGIPEIGEDEGEVAVGNQLYAVNCAGCHNSAGSGGALGHGAYAPSITEATSRQVAEAVRVGPGAMPIFGPDTLTDHDVASIVRYVEYLKHPRNAGGAPLGRVGPIPEGMVAWVVGLGSMLAVARWIGTTE